MWQHGNQWRLDFLKTPRIYIKVKDDISDKVTFGVCDKYQLWTYHNHHHQCHHYNHNIITFKMFMSRLALKTRAMPQLHPICPNTLILTLTSSSSAHHHPHPHYQRHQHRHHHCQNLPQKNHLNHDHWHCQSYHCAMNANVQIHKHVIAINVITINIITININAIIVIAIIVIIAGELFVNGSLLTAIPSSCTDSDWANQRGGKRTESRVAKSNLNLSRSKLSNTKNAWMVKKIPIEQIRQIQACRLKF